MEHLTCAYTAGRSTPKNDETQRPGRAIGFQDTNQRRSADIIPFSAASSNCDKPKLIARLARAGHLVHDGGNDDYIVVQTDWGMSRYCADYAALVAFGRQLGVNHDA